MESRREQVAREDLRLFINACFAATGQREFYDRPGTSSAREREKSLAFLHAYVCGNYRVLYSRTLAAGVNDFARARIVLQLLGSGKETPGDFRVEENALIRAALRSLPPQRVYKLFGQLRKDNINNRRTRAVIRDYMAWRPDPTFDAVKYRSKVRSAARHTHLRLTGETGVFLFGGMARPRSFATPLFETFRQAHYSQEAIYQLPYSIAEGFAARRGIPRERFLERIADQMTRSERERTMQLAASHKVKLAVDLTRMPLTKLVLYVLSLPLPERRSRLDALETAVRRAAWRALHQSLPIPATGTVAAVLDASYSASGSEERKRRPLAVAIAAHYLLREAIGSRYSSYWCGGGEEVAESPLLASARGTTDLVTPLIDALETRPSLVLIVSDGYENDPPGGVDAIAKLWRTRLDPDSKTAIVHLNPVFATDEYEPHALSQSIPTLGVRDAEEIGISIAFARFTAASDFAGLADYLRAQTIAFLRRYESEVEPCEETLLPEARSPTLI